MSSKGNEGKGDISSYHVKIPGISVALSSCRSCIAHTDILPRFAYLNQERSHPDPTWNHLFYQRHNNVGFTWVTNCPYRAYIWGLVTYDEWEMIGYMAGRKS